MTDSNYTASSPAALPRVSLDAFFAMLIAGAVATVAFDIWGQTIAPWLGLGNLAPTPLAQGFLGKLGFADVGRPEGYFMHLFVVGMIGYPIGYMLVFKPLWDRFVGVGGWLAPAAVYGAALWVVAIGAIAGWVTGNVFLGFTRITWVALAGHVFYGIALGATLAWLSRRAA
ncbi:MAG: hypothetical protein AAGA70_13855 [Pseudomonadota bacterium]